MSGTEKFSRTWMNSAFFRMSKSAPTLMRIAYLSTESILTDKILSAITAAPVIIKIIPM